MKLDEIISGIIGGLLIVALFVGCLAFIASVAHGMTTP
jgi:hypothetical protein